MPAIPATTEAANTPPASRVVAIPVAAVTPEEAADIARERRDLGSRGPLYRAGPFFCAQTLVRCCRHAVIEPSEETVVVSIALGKAQRLNPPHAYLSSIGRVLQDIHGLGNELIQRHGIGIVRLPCSHK